MHSAPTDVTDGADAATETAVEKEARERVESYKAHSSCHRQRASPAGAGTPITFLGRHYPEAPSCHGMPPWWLKIPQAGGRPADVGKTQ